MEPPTKRQRRGNSPLDGPDDDDDELCFEPVDVSAKRDPSFRLSLQRAYADNRFQATMAHIFEKYSRDFDGIGDEIDMVTGEIVVDNGHLKNMRNEVDVGVPANEDESSDDDEGLLLSDLLDDEDDPFSARAPTSRDAPASDKDQEDEEDQILSGRRTGAQSQALVPTSRNQLSSTSFASPNLLAGVPGACPLGFGSPFAFGASPLNFGASPLAGPSWSLTGGFPASPWNAPVFSSPMSRLLPSPSEHRYEFPVQQGDSSIWAPGYRFKENEQGDSTAQLAYKPAPARPKTRKRPMKYICPSAGPNATEEEVDEDAILMGKAPLGGTTFDNDVLSDIQDTPIRAVDRPKIDIPGNSPSNGSIRIRKRRKYPPATTVANKRRSRPSRKSEEMTSECHYTLQNQSTIEDDSNSSSDTSHRATRGTQRFMVEIPSLTGSSREEYQEVEEAPEEIADSAGDEAEPEASQQEELKDDQNTPKANAVAIPLPEDNPLAPSQDGNREGQEPPQEILEMNTLQSNTVHTAHCLSDDEMPLWRKPIRPKRQRKGKRGSSPRHSPAPPDSGIGESVGTQSSNEDHDPPKSPELETSDAPMAQEEPVEDDAPMASQEANHSPAAAPLVPTEEHMAASMDAEPEAPTETRSHGLTRELRWLRKLNGPDMDNVSLWDSPRGYLLAKPRRRTATRLNLGVDEPDTGPGSVNQEQQLEEKEEEKKDDTPQAQHEEASTPEPTYDESRSPLFPSAEPEASQQQEKEDDTHSAQCEEAPNPEVTNEESHSPLFVPTDPEISPPPSPPVEQHTPLASPSKPPLPLPATHHSPTSPAGPASTPTPKPQTPRHTSIPITHAPSSRRSILSLVSAAADDDDQDETELDELGTHRHDGRTTFAQRASSSFLSSGASRKIWKSTSRTTEIYHTPVKRRATDVLSPGSVVQTPGGTLRACGLEGYRCGRDFCFTCL